MADSPIARARAAASLQAPEEAPVEEPAVTSDSRPKFNYYCLEPRHAAELISGDRFFYYEHPTRKQRLPDGQVVDVPTENCPVCPVCKDPHGNPKQVSAAALELDDNGEPQIPASLLVLADRL